jgi:hypothetical protein
VHAFALFSQNFALIFFIVSSAEGKYFFNTHAEFPYGVWLLPCKLYGMHLSPEALHQQQTRL